MLAGLHACAFLAFERSGQTHLRPTQPKTPSLYMRLFSSNSGEELDEKSSLLPRAEVSRADRQHRASTGAMQDEEGALLDGHHAASDEAHPARHHNVAAIARWKQSANQVVQARRVSEAIAEASSRMPGAAPGIDVKRQRYTELSAKWCLPFEVRLQHGSSGC